MNIVFFMQDTGAVFGAERATLDLAAGLRDAGDVPVFFLIAEDRLSTGGGALHDTIEHEGFAIERFPVSGRISFAMAKEVRSRFTAIGGDILHVIGYKANLHARISGIHPVVATVHGWLYRNDVKERLYDAIDRWCLRRCDHVVCLSSYYENLLLRSGVSRDRLSRIPSGLRKIPGDVELDISSAGKTVTTFGMLGRFSEEKNHAMFLNAAQQAARQYPKLRFRLAGQGPCETKIKESIEQLGLHNAVELTGYTDVNVYMKQIDAFVICSTIENLPYSILEAMAWGKPVIGTSVGGIPDLIESGVTGELVKSGDAASLAGVMVNMHEQPELARDMGAAGRRRLLDQFTLFRSVEKHRNVYQALLRS